VLKKRKNIFWEWWYAPVIPALRRLGQEDCEFKASLGYNSEILTQTPTQAWCQWLAPIILAPQEAELKRIKVQSQPRANSSRDPIYKILNIKRASGVAQSEGPEFKPQYSKEKKKEKLCTW
jgi:hypothetical protein